MMQLPLAPALSLRQIAAFSFAIILLALPHTAQTQGFGLGPSSPTQYDSVTIYAIGTLPGCPCMTVDILAFERQGNTFIVEVATRELTGTGGCSCEIVWYSIPFELGRLEAGIYHVTAISDGQDRSFDFGVRYSSLHVPDDYPTIQAAIDAVLPGDTVLVAPGTYTGDGNRDIDFGGKNTIVRSEAGPELTIIDCGGTEGERHRGFYFHSGESREAVVEGFTIRNGLAPLYPHWISTGGAIASVAAGPTIRGNRIESCTAMNASCDLGTCTVVGSGGGIYCQYSDALIEDNLLQNCIPNGIACEHGSPVVHNNTILASASGMTLASVEGDAVVSNNDIIDNENYGLTLHWCDVRVIGNLVAGCRERMGVVCNESNAIIENNTVVYNAGWRLGLSTHYAGGLVIYGGRPMLRANIFAFNGNGSIECRDGAMPVMECNNIFGNEGYDWGGYIADQYGLEGNISADPLFCDPENGDYSLDITSPCAWRHNECQETIGAYDVGCGSYMCGDTDYDGQVTSADVMLLTTAYFDRSAPWPFPIATGDLNCNGSIELNDLVLLAGWVHGYGPTPCCSGDNKKRETLSEGDSGRPLH